MASEINREEFLGISFSHHMEILHKTKDIHEILFYIHQTVLHKWDKYDLRDCFERNLYAKNGAATNKKKGSRPFSSLWARRLLSRPPALSSHPSNSYLSTNLFT